MVIKDMKQIFGDMPIEYLPAAQALAKKQFKNRLLIAGGLGLLATGIFIGYKLSNNKKQNFVRIEDPKVEPSKDESISTGLKRKSNPVKGVEVKVN